MIHHTNLINITLFLLIYFFAFVVGLLLLGSKNKNIPSLIIVVSPVIGLLSLGIQLYIYGLLNIPWNLLSLALPWVLLFIINFKNQTLKYKKIIMAFLDFINKNFFQANILQKLIILLLFYCLIIISLNVITAPVVGGDAIAMWLYKAKAYLLQNSANIDFFKADLARHIDYPPLLSLIYDIYFIISKQYNGTLANSSILVFLFSALACMFIVFKKMCGEKRAWLLLLLFICLPFFYPFLIQYHYMGFADLFIGLVFLMVTIFLYIGFSEKKIDFVMIGLFLAFSGSLIKNEGLMWLFVTFIIVLINAKNIDRFYYKLIKSKISIYCVILLLTLISWNLQIKLKGIGSEFTSLLIIKRISYEHVLETAKIINTYLASHQIFYTVFLALLISLPIVIFRKSKLLTSLFIGLLIVVAAYFLIYVVSPYDTTWQVNFSIDRIITHIIPSTFFLFAILIFKKPLTSSKDSAVK